MIILRADLKFASFENLSLTATWLVLEDTVLSEIQTNADRLPHVRMLTDDLICRG